MPTSMAVAIFRATSLILAATVCGGLAVACSAKPEHSRVNESPDSGLLGALGLGSSADLANFRARAAAREQDLIAACMRESGFRYIPVLSDKTSQEGDSRLVDPQTEDDANRNGFRLAASGGVHEPPVAREDPNLQVVHSLSPSQRTAYYRALDDIQPDGTTGTRGCRQVAHREVHGAIEQASADLEPAIVSMRRRLEADREFLAISRAWADCMEGEGFPYGSHEELRRDLTARYTRLRLQVGPQPRASGGQRAQRPTLVTPDPKGVDAAASYERQVAVAFVRCWEPLRERERSLYLRYVRELAAGEAEAIAALREAMGAE